MRFFCYGRKSVYSDHSDSVDNQQRMCRDYVSAKFRGDVESFTCFSDEDFSGANAELDSLSVKFISLKENIDTATPIGRAMMYVTVIFAQMERETTAVRVLDNMRGLSKKGYWTGGNPPTGYVRQRVVEDGRKHVIIVPDPDGVAYVRKVFSDFLSMNCSLQHSVRFLRGPWLPDGSRLSQIFLGRIRRRDDLRPVLRTKQTARAAASGEVDRFPRAAGAVYSCF